MENKTTFISRTNRNGDYLTVIKSKINLYRRICRINTFAAKFHRLYIKILTKRDVKWNILELTAAVGAKFAVILTVSYDLRGRR